MSDPSGCLFSNMGNIRCDNGITPAFGYAGGITCDHYGGSNVLESKAKQSCQAINGNWVNDIGTLHFGPDSILVDGCCVSGSNSKSKCKSRK